MPFKGNDFQYSRGEAYATITSGVYGDEHDDKIAELVDLENGVRKYWSDQLRGLAKVTADISEAQHLWKAALLLDPYSEEEGPEGAFARTKLDDRPEGAKWVTPNDEE